MNSNIYTNITFIGIIEKLRFTLENIPKHSLFSLAKREPWKKPTFDRK